jgi:hypothetical protein
MGHGCRAAVLGCPWLSLTPCHLGAVQGTSDLIGPVLHDSFRAVFCFQHHFVVVFLGCPAAPLVVCDMCTPHAAEPRLLPLCTPKQPTGISNVCDTSGPGAGSSRCGVVWCGVSPASFCEQALKNGSENGNHSKALASSLISRTTYYPRISGA